MNVKLMRMWSGEDVVADQEIDMLACLTELMVECEFK